MNYCDHCGNKVEIRKEGTEWYCPHCKRYAYLNPVPTIDAMLFDEGFVDPDETLEQGIARELREELGISPADYSPLRYASSRTDSHTGRQTIAIIMTGYLNHREFEPNDEVDEYSWMLPSELTPDMLTNEREYVHIVEVAATTQ